MKRKGFRAAAGLTAGMLLGLTTGLFAGAAAVPAYAAAPEQEYSSELPVLYLDFDIDQVIATKSVYTEGSMYLKGNGRFGGGEVAYDGAVEVKGRGNTSWSERKKPFKLKLDKKADLFGMGENKHWVLLANATDDSLLRDELSYKLAGAFGMTYQDGTWVDLVVNGKYYGNYYLCEHVRIGKTRVPIDNIVDDADAAADAVFEAGVFPDLKKKDLEEQFEEDLSWIDTDTFTSAGKTIKVSDYYKFDAAALRSGGILFEMDEYYDEVSKFRSSLNNPVMFNTPEFADTSAGLRNEAELALNTFELAIQSDDFCTDYRGQHVSAYDLFDLDSLVKYFIVEEVFHNEDSMRKSTYFYKERDGKDSQAGETAVNSAAGKNEPGSDTVVPVGSSIGKFYMGPVWDMDWSSGGEGTGRWNEWRSCNEDIRDSFGHSSWYLYLRDDPVFTNALYEYYHAHRADIQDMVNSIYGEAENDIFVDNAYAYLRRSAMANEERWGSHRKGFEKEVKVLSDWFGKRLTWLDEQFESPKKLRESLGSTDRVTTAEVDGQAESEGQEGAEQETSSEAAGS